MANDGGILNSVVVMLTVAIMIFVAIVIIANLEKNTTGVCSLANTTEANSTVLNTSATTMSHGFVLSGYMSSTSREQIPKAVVTYVQGNESCNVTYADGTLLVNLDGTSPDTLTFTKAQAPDNIMTIKYTNCGTSNITKTNLTYYKISECDYTEDAYNNIATSTSYTYIGLGLAPIAILIFAVVTVIGSIMLLSRKD